MKNQRGTYQLLLSPLSLPLPHRFSFKTAIQHLFSISLSSSLHSLITHPNKHKRMLHMEQDRDAEAATTIATTTTTGEQQGGLSSQSRPMGSKVPLGTFVYASAPARIDLAGGWTDTIPIT